MIPLRRAQADGPLRHPHRHAAPITRGMGPDEMRHDRRLDFARMKSPKDEAALATIRQEVSQLCQQFPVPAAKLVGS